MVYQVPRQLMQQTFGQFRACGRGRNECQALWVSSLARPDELLEVVHPAHSASPVGFQLDDDWLTTFWLRMAREGLAVRIQVHTHPGAAYHSATDDAFPMVHSPGFLSLVIPEFAMREVGFERAYLAQIDAAGRWREVSINEHLELV